MGSISMMLTDTFHFQVQNLLFQADRLPDGRVDFLSDVRNLVLNTNYIDIDFREILRATIGNISNDRGDSLVAARSHITEAGQPKIDSLWD